MTSARSREKEGYTVTYDSSSHLKVIFQRWGSVWPRVWPYCFFNVVLMATIGLLHSREGLDLAISDKGHSYMSLLLAFLVVSRVNLGVGRYNQARGDLEMMYRESRELMQNACIFSNHITNSIGKEWRSDMAYRCMILIRTAMAMIDYKTTKIPSWDCPELTQEESDQIKSDIYCETDSPINALRWAHKVRSEEEENMRVPVRMAYALRETIHSEKILFGSDKLETTQENMLLASVSSFMNGYYGMRKFMTTPVPFPLVQMARTFLFFYVFTVPFTLLDDRSDAVVHCIVVFIITYGFMGLETVSMELDNPFGDDDNDFDNLEMAYISFEDTYLLIGSIDGPEYADRLRAKMSTRQGASVPSLQLPRGERTSLLSNKL